MTQICIDVTHSPEDRGFYCEIWTSESGQVIPQYAADICDLRSDAVDDGKRWIREHNLSGNVRVKYLN